MGTLMRKLRAFVQQERGAILVLAAFSVVGVLSATGLSIDVGRIVKERRDVQNAADAAAHHGVAIHAYVLMDNHFHLLATPQTAEGLPQMMQAVGRSYVRYFNDTHRRTGTLWEGRYKSTVIQTERYLLACMVYCRPRLARVPVS